MCAASVAHTFLISGGKMAKRDISVNQRIRMCRKERGLNQTCVAEVLGIKTSTYSQMERKGYITCENLKILAEVLEVSIEYLLYGIKTEKDVGVIPPNTKRYEFLEDISNSELKILRQTLFHLKREKRNLVYHYAIDIIKKKRNVKKQGL